MKKAIFVAVAFFSDGGKPMETESHVFGSHCEAVKWANEGGRLGSNAVILVLRTLVTSDHRLAPAEIERAMSRNPLDYTRAYECAFTDGERVRQRLNMPPYLFALHFVNSLT